jgi:hypothetical protein
MQIGIGVAIGGFALLCFFGVLLFITAANCQDDDDDLWRGW